MNSFTFLFIGKTFFCRANTEEGEYHKLPVQGPVVIVFPLEQGMESPVLNTLDLENVSQGGVGQPPTCHSLGDQLLWQLRCTR